MLQANLRAIVSLDLAEAGSIFFIGRVLSFGCLGVTCSAQGAAARVSRKRVIQARIVYVAAF